MSSFIMNNYIKFFHHSLLLTRICQCLSVEIGFKINMFHCKYGQSILGFRHTKFGSSLHRKDASGLMGLGQESVCLRDNRYGCGDGGPEHGIQNKSGYKRKLW